MSKETTSTPVNIAVNVIRHDILHNRQIKMFRCKSKYRNAGTLTLVYHRFVLTSLRSTSTSTLARVPEDKTHQSNADYTSCRHLSLRTGVLLSFKQACRHTQTEIGKVYIPPVKASVFRNEHDAQLESSLLVNVPQIGLLVICRRPRSPLLNVID